MLGGNERSFGDKLEKEIGMLLPEKRRQEADDRERDLNLYRSGSAPPTVEGSLNAVEGFFGAGKGGGGYINPVEFSGANSGNGFLSEEELRCDPAYLTYYYSNVNLNPRLPPPFLSKEDWRSAQRLKGESSVLGGTGDRRKVNRVDDGAGRFLLSMPPGFNSTKQETEKELNNPLGSSEWGRSDGSIGLVLGLGRTQKSLGDIFQDDLSSTTPSRPASHSALIENAENVGLNEYKLVSLRNDLTSSDSFRSIGNCQGSTGVQSIGQPSSYTYAAAVGAFLSRSNTPDPQLVAKAPSPCPTPIGGGRGGKVEKRSVASPNSFNGISSNINEAVDVVAALSGMSLSPNGVRDNESHLSQQLEQDDDNYQNPLFGLKDFHDGIEQTSFVNKSESDCVLRSSLSLSVKAPFSDLSKSNGGALDLMNSSKGRHFDLHQSSVSSANSYLKGSPTSTLSGGAQYQHIDEHGIGASFSNYGSGGYSMNPRASVMTGQLGTGNVPLLFENVAAASVLTPVMDPRVLGSLASGPNQAAVISESHNVGRLGNLLAANAVQAPFTDPMHLQYLRTLDYTAVPTINDSFTDRNYPGNSYMNLHELQNAYLGALLSPQKSHYGIIPFSGKSAGSNHHGHYGNPVFGIGFPYQGSTVLSNSPVGPGSPMRQNELNSRFASDMRNLAGGIIGPWNLNAGCNMDGSFASLLEEFKSNKTLCFELSEISGHVVEFSVDQYGSRFIQQKLETAATDEKKMVYQEIMPQALALMTDVFGNYVIQKFFEHGLPSQRRELANKILGHVLTLSLQMYGCRVIQKAIEVVDLDQKIKMVEELDGHVMHCVRDQNGNHVIQKCIECVPEDAIHFIVSTFFNQAVTLSTHSYGCRVIQRVLEHCQNPETQNKVMEEILGAVSMLAQDQYGNYVVQHVLEHGRPHERSAIIKELAGKIVQMSQQKFASNVVEKCLTFSGLAERQLVVNEMLGTTDENEPLQAMMKDQFANYVVQKVLETCDDRQRELILTRIKVHLEALKKYTYGKHIVARVEKLVAAGERRMATQSLRLVA